jgi:hypothetical protein
MGNNSYSKGISWIDDCRIPFVDEQDRWVIDRDREVVISNPQHSGREDIKWKRNGLDTSTTQGRFPANILVSDDMLNDGVISKSNDNIMNNTLEQKIYGGGNGLPPQASKGFNDKGSNSRYYNIDKWFDNIISE